MVSHSLTTRGERKGNVSGFKDLGTKRLYDNQVGAVVPDNFAVEIWPSRPGPGLQITSSVGSPITPVAVL
jgi:hypothetical protein